MPPRRGSSQSESLEGEPCLTLHDSMPSLVQRIPKGHQWRTRLIFTVLVECQTQSRVVVLEGAIRMVQEVVAREPERQLLVLGGPEREVLEHRKVAVEVMGAS